jgi:hypothetical protein
MMTMLDRRVVALWAPFFLAIPVCLLSSYFWSSAVSMLVLEQMIGDFKVNRQFGQHVRTLSRCMMTICYARPLAWLWVAEVVSTVSSSLENKAFSKLLPLVDYKHHFMHLPLRMARMRPHYFRSLLKGKHAAPIFLIIVGSLVLMARTTIVSPFNCICLIVWCFA